jgi:DNA helicase-2/ATP-dependent DNA helicase PcrA
VTATAGVLAALCKNYLLPTSEERCRLLGKYRKKFLPFYEHYTAMSVMLAQNDIKTLNEYFVEKFAVRQHYRRIEDNISVDDLMTIVLEESKKYGDARICLSNFLSEAALSGSQMDFLIAKLKKIPIITVHQSKGCEFKTVILAGVDDRHFPSFAAEKSGNEEEEKRVFYVAISRAKQRLIMTYYENARTQGGAIYQKGRSKYLEKIPAQTIEFL